MDRDNKLGIAVTVTVFSVLVAFILLLELVKIYGMPNVVECIGETTEDRTPP